MKKASVIIAASSLVVLSAGRLQAAFIYHDSATTTGGTFNASFPLSNLKNAGHTSHLDTENTATNSESYATASPATGGFPVTITLDFTATVDLSHFYLWNHSNNNGSGAPANGVGDFVLTFFDGVSGAGSQIGEAYSGTAVAAPGTGSTAYTAQVFNFGTTYSGVRSVLFKINNKANGTTSTFVAAKEIGFETAVAPEPASALLGGLGLLVLLRRRRG